MVRLDKPWRRYLSKKDFEQYPLWVWDDGNEGYLPFIEPYSFEYGTLFIKATLETHKYKFDGCLVGTHKFYAFGLFINNKKIIINLSLINEINKDLKSIYEILNCKPFPFFPLRYHSDITYSDGGKISGVFEFKDGKLSCTPDDWEQRWEKLKAEVEKKYGRTE